MDKKELEEANALIDDNLDLILEALDILQLISKADDSIVN